LGAIAGSFRFYMRVGDGTRSEGAMGKNNSQVKRSIKDLKASISELDDDYKKDINYRYTMAQLQYDLFEALPAKKRVSMPASSIIRRLQNDDNAKKVLGKYKCHIHGQPVSIKEVCKERGKNRKFNDINNTPVFDENLHCIGGKYYYVFIAFDRKDRIFVVGKTSFDKGTTGFGDLLGTFVYLGDEKKDLGWADRLASFVSTDEDHKKDVIAYYDSPSDNARDEAKKGLINNIKNDQNYFDNYIKEAIIIPVIKGKDANERAESVEFLIGKILADMWYPIVNYYSHYMRGNAPAWFRKLSIAELLKAKYIKYYYINKTT
jgi:hypothetical protein